MAPQIALSAGLGSYTRVCGPTVSAMQWTQRNWIWSRSIDGMTGGEREQTRQSLQKRPVEKEIYLTGRMVVLVMSKRL